MNLPRSQDRQRIAFITGASTGIGAASARALDERGWRVLAGVRSAVDGERLRADCSQRLMPVLIDVTRPEMIAAAAETVAEIVEGGSLLAGLVNNAGIVVTGPLELVSLDQWRRQFEVNLFGQVAVTQALLPLLRKSRGRIVNVSSISGILAPPFMAPYAASKHALEAISEALRMEVRHWGISVSLVEPASVKTPIWDKVETAAAEFAHGLSAEGERLYGPDIAAMRRATARMGIEGMPVTKVVGAVLHALESPRPKARYPLGISTRLAALYWRQLPARLQEWILRWQLRLPKSSSGAQ